MSIEQDRPPLARREPSDVRAAPEPPTPVVSVVIATNRNPPFLREAISSVQEQTLEGVELILVDDGSPFGGELRGLVESVPHGHYLRQAHAGKSVARNFGAFRASGRYLAFLDDDDRWSPHRLARQVEALEAEPLAALSYCRVRTIDAQGLEIAPGDQTRVDGVQDVIRRRTGILMPNILIRRESFFRVGGFSPEFKHTEDYDLLLRLILDGDITFVDEVLVDYRAHDANSTRDFRGVARDIDAITRFHMWAAGVWGRDELIDAYRASLAANNRFAAWSAARSARSLLRERRPVAAAGEIAWALRFAPTAPLDWARKRIRPRAEDT